MINCLIFLLSLRELGEGTAHNAANSTDQTVAEATSFDDSNIYSIVGDASLRRSNSKYEDCHTVSEYDYIKWDSLQQQENSKEPSYKTHEGKKEETDNCCEFFDDKVYGKCSSVAKIWPQKHLDTNSLRETEYVDYDEVKNVFRNTSCGSENLISKSQHEHSIPITHHVKVSQQERVIQGKSQPTKHKITSYRSCHFDDPVYDSTLASTSHCVTQSYSDVFNESELEKKRRLLRIEVLSSDYNWQDYSNIDVILCSTRNPAGAKKQTEVIEATTTTPVDLFDDPVYSACGSTTQL